jgi:polar amino acid transport system substrate-binding protein
MAYGATADTIEIHGSFAQDIPPYLWVEDGQVHGIELEIMQAALEPRGYKVVGKPLPINRMWRTFANADLDFAAGLQIGEVPGALYSDEFLEYADVAITKADRPFRLSSPNDLFRHRVVVWQNAFVDLGLDRRNLPDAPHVAGGGFIEAADSESQIRFFWADRADILVIDRYIYAWYQKRLKDLPDNGTGIAVYDIFAPQIRVRVGFRDQKLCDEFNAGLKEIRENGTYAKIFERYALRF